MGKFAKKDPVAVAKTQAANVMKQMQGTHLRSVGTVRNYEQALAKVARYANAEHNCSLKQLTPEQVYQYLEYRGQEVGQKTLDMERQAVQAMMHHVTKSLPEGERLNVIKSEQDAALSSRAYTAEQVSLIANSQTERNALATEIAHAAGLRAHELLTLQRIDDRTPDERPALESKWQGRQGESYTVQGKGGLVREVRIPSELAVRLESLRLDEPQRVTDRGVHYTQSYALNGGEKWSKSFSAASARALNWSAGAHGVRHSYAQERMHELQHQGLTRDKALETVSQEMGHFRPSITETYLR